MSITCHSLNRTSSIIMPCLAAALSIYSLTRGIKLQVTDNKINNCFCKNIKNSDCELYFNNKYGKGLSLTNPSELCKSVWSDSENKFADSISLFLGALVFLIVRIVKLVSNKCCMEVTDDSPPAKIKNQKDEDEEYCDAFVCSMDYAAGLPFIAIPLLGAFFFNTLINRVNECYCTNTSNLSLDSCKSDFEMTFRGLNITNLNDFCSPGGGAKLMSEETKYWLTITASFIGLGFLCILVNAGRLCYRQCCPVRK